MKVAKILVFIVLCIAVLGVLMFVFPSDGVSIGRMKLRFIPPSDIFAIDTSEAKNLDTILLNNRIEERLAKLQTMKDSFEVYMDYASNSPSRFYFPENDLTFLEAFYKKLESAKKEKRIIRILHYGDSQIEMDRITGYLRHEFQKRFGGEGPGLIPAIQGIPSGTVSQSFSGALTPYAVYGNMAGRVSHRRYGIMCQMAQLNGNAVISFRKGYAAPARADRFSKVSLIIGKPQPGFTAELFNGDQSFGLQAMDDSTEVLKLLVWNTERNLREAKLVLNGKAEIYGIALDGAYGVAMDNIPMRGSSGETYTGIESTSLAQAYKDMDAGLIILQFGGNAMPAISSTSRAEWYGGVMGKQIAYLKKIYPQAHILFIGPSDMSKNINGTMQTWPHLMEVNAALKKAALDNGAVWWDLFETMGGENSMPLWVNASPQLAAPDYIHFTPRGAQKVAEILLNSFLNDYELYRLRKEASNISKQSALGQ